MQYDHLLVRYGELTLKKVRIEKCLLINLKIM